MGNLINSRKKVCKKSGMITRSSKRKKKKIKKSVCKYKIMRYYTSPPQINIIFPSGTPSSLVIPEPIGPPKIASISILPQVERYFYITSSPIHLTSIKTIEANQFINDDGEYTDHFKDFGHNGYFNLYINAVLQEGKVYTVCLDALTITSTGQSIPSGTPIILESVGFAVEHAPP